MILTGGAISENVFWAVRKDVILGNSSSFFGTLIASSIISVGKKAVIHGQILSASSVIFDGDCFILNPNAKSLETDTN
jgi:cytoskeletal protein CcmA (bactofilin family)